MNPFKRFLRDPLLHFLAAGGLLFAAYQLIAGPQATKSDDAVIEVDRSKLLTFMQYESVAFQPKYFAAQFDSMSDQQKRDLIAKYVREEALYREAQAMGLSEGDYVIRRRMVEKMLYLIDDTATEPFAPTDADLKAYYLKHQDRYEVAPSLTFTHVFVDSEVKRPQPAKQVAERLKKELQAKGAGFDDAPAYGDRFPYLQNYVDRDPSFIEHQLGTDFASAVMKLKPSDHAWYGPIKSQFGYHLVLITRHQPAYLPKLADIRDELREDLLRDTVASNREKAVTDLVNRFKVKLDGISPKQDESLTAEMKHASGSMQ
ncbi:MAG: peptidylprolyl isomerase [Alphaproteobacteria bacterium]